MTPCCSPSEINDWCDALVDGSAHRVPLSLCPFFCSLLKHPRLSLTPPHTDLAGSVSGLGAAAGSSRRHSSWGWRTAASCFAGCRFPSNGGQGGMEGQWSCHAIFHCLLLFPSAQCSPRLRRFQSSPMSAVLCLPTRHPLRIPWRLLCAPLWKRWGGSSWLVASDWIFPFE
jgi:hypothetical protein